jgi:hypothetical protein
MSDVFVSYARVDQPFVRRLCASLALLSKDVWADFEDIPPTAAWLEEVFRGIDAAHTFAFVITPDSVRSGFAGVNWITQSTTTSASFPSFAGRWRTRIPSPKRLPH